MVENCAESCCECRRRRLSPPDVGVVEHYSGVWIVVDHGDCPRREHLLGYERDIREREGEPRHHRIVQLVQFGGPEASMVDRREGCIRDDISVDMDCLVRMLSVKYLQRALCVAVPAAVVASPRVPGDAIATAGARREAIDVSVEPVRDEVAVDAEFLIAQQVVHHWPKGKVAVSEPVRVLRKCVRRAARREERFVVLDEVQRADAIVAPVRQDVRRRPCRRDASVISRDRVSQGGNVAVEPWPGSANDPHVVVEVAAVAVVQQQGVAHACIGDGSHHAEQGSMAAGATAGREYEPRHTRRPVRVAHDGRARSADCMRIGEILGMDGKP